MVDSRFSTPYAERTPRINAGGNFCGHDPLLPDLTLVKPMKKRGKGELPWILTRLAERLQGYYNNPGKLPGLNMANGSARQQRSERREACLKVMAALLKHTDLVSLRVGIPQTDGFTYLGFSVIASATGMHPKRVARAVHDLKAAGILTVQRLWQTQPDGTTHKGVAGVKTLTRHLFTAFGLGGELLNTERKKAVKRLKRKLGTLPKRRSSKAGKARLVMLQRGKLQADGPKPAPSPAAPASHESDDYRRRLMLKKLELMQDHPDLPPTEYDKLARQLI